MFIGTIFKLPGFYTNSVLQQESQTHRLKKALRNEGRFAKFLPKKIDLGQDKIVLTAPHKKAFADQLNYNLAKADKKYSPENVTEDTLKKFLENNPDGIVTIEPEETISTNFKA
ncbi:MAG: hypothetical protein VKJ06_04040 [Vampirovibrionales bacterium]|nr:hypothetical protein [Vampirovibrionales bacterium]